MELGVAMILLRTTHTLPLSLYLRDAFWPPHSPLFLLMCVRPSVACVSDCTNREDRPPSDVCMSSALEFVNSCHRREGVRTAGCGCGDGGARPWCSSLTYKPHRVLLLYSMYAFLSSTGLHENTPKSRVTGVSSYHRRGVGRQLRSPPLGWREQNFFLLSRHPREGLTHTQATAAAEEGGRENTTTGRCSLLLLLRSFSDRRPAAVGRRRSN